MRPTKAEAGPCSPAARFDLEMESSQGTLLPLLPPPPKSATQPRSLPSVRVHGLVCPARELREAQTGRRSPNHQATRSTKRLDIAPSVQIRRRISSSRQWSRWPPC